MTRCAIMHVDAYDEDKVLEAMREIADATAFPDVEGQTVLVKPNILSDSYPEKAITTHPAVIKALITLLWEKGAKRILTGDSPGMQTGRFNPVNSGLRKVAEETGAEIVDFRESTRIHEVEGIRIPMTDAIDKADIVISAAKFKTHQLMSATGAVKNMFGLVPGLQKSPMHLRARTPESFARLILSIFREAHVDYAVIDAIEGMEGAGPTNGQPRHVGLLMGSENAFALDKAEAIIMGYRSVPIIEEAEKRFPGITDAEYPLLNPEDLIIRDYRRIPEGKKTTLRTLFLPNLLSRIGIATDGRAYPEFIHSECRHCLKCVNVCPAKALEMKGGRIHISRRKCIRCYCCHEMCPFDAIKVK